MFRKLRLTFLALAIGIGISQAQLSTYNFSATTGGAAAFVPISGGTTPSFTGTQFDAGPGNDEGYANNLPIGFTFDIFVAKHASPLDVASVSPDDESLAFLMRLLRVTSHPKRYPIRPLVHIQDYSVDKPKAC